MTPFQTELENNINRMLQKSLIYEKELEKRGEHELVKQVRRTTSVLAEYLLKAYGINEAYQDFWSDKKSLAQNIN